MEECKTTPCIKKSSCGINDMTKCTSGTLRTAGGAKRRVLLRSVHRFGTSAAQTFFG